MTSSSPPAAVPAANPALQPLAFLIGAWRTTGTHPELPGETLHGRTSFAWHEGGAFLIIRAEIDRAGFPGGVAIVGSDGDAGRLVMAYHDERGVSRIFEATAGERSVTWRRDDPSFAQSMTIAAEAGGDRLVGTGRMSRTGGAWVGDLSMVYLRDGDPSRSSPT